MADAAVELPLLAARLKEAGLVGVRTQMVAGLRRAAKPIIPPLRAAAAAKLPKAGGLNELVAGQPITASVRTSAGRAGVSIRAQFTRTNRGMWRHPVFGQPGVWTEQTFDPAKGWFDDTAKEHAPAAKVEMQSVLVTVAAQVNRMGL